MTSLFIGTAIATVVGVVALLARSRLASDTPTQRSFSVPAQLDRADFGSPAQEWLIAIFTSATCPVCADVVAKASPMASPQVAVRVVDFPTRRDIHTRYAIDAVPMVLIADSRGVVVHHEIGPVTATDLWAAVARVRDGVDPESIRCEDSGPASN